MHTRHLLASLAVAAGLGACHSSSYGAGDTPSPSSGYKASGSDSTAMAGARTFQLQSANNSGVTGSVMLHPNGSQTTVMLNLTPPAGGTASGSHVAHIHTGTCAAPGPVVAPLGTVTASGNAYTASTSNVAIAMSALLDGQHIVAAHASDETTPTIACTALSGM